MCQGEWYCKNEGAVYTDILEDNGNEFEEVWLASSLVTRAVLCRSYAKLEASNFWGIISAVLGIHLDSPCQICVAW